MIILKLKQIFYGFIDDFFIAKKDTLSSIGFFEKAMLIILKERYNIEILYG